MLHDLGHTPGHNTLHDTSQWNSAAAVTLDDDEDWTACLDLLAGGDERSLAHPEVKPGLRGSLATQGVTELQKSKPLGHLRCGAIERRRESQRSFRARAKVGAAIVCSSYWCLFVAHLNLLSV